MSGPILLFPATPRTFKPRVDVRDVYQPEAETMAWVVEVLDRNGQHKLGQFDDPEEEVAFADEFRINFFNPEGSAA